MIVVYIDGLCEPVNPGGVATYGFIIYRKGIKIQEKFGIYGHGPRMSNNVAEYQGLIGALRALKDLEFRENNIIIRSDSRLLVNQMNGLWQSKNGLYMTSYSIAKTLLKDFSNIIFEWIPREQNKEADELSRKAYNLFGK